MDASISRIKSLHIQGAKNVALAGIRILNKNCQKMGGRDGKRFLMRLQNESKKISRTRPTEPALRNALSYILFRASKGKNVGGIKRIVGEESLNFSKGIENTINQIAETGANRIQSGSVIFTHCHSNTVMRIFKKAKAAGKKFSVICTETRPLFQGRLTAHELSRMRIPATMVIDSAARAFMKKCDLVLLGADAIASNGAVINKIGSSLVALAAKEQKKPVYVAAGSHKIDPITLRGFLEPIEERSPREICNKIKGVTIRNPAFDVVPAEYIDGIITEFGIVPPQGVYSIIQRKFPWLKKQGWFE